MWQAEHESLGSEVERVSVLQHGRRLAYATVLELWRGDAGFRDWFNRLLAEAPFPAYFWETPRVTGAALDRAFEFVFVAAPLLARLRPDPAPFEAQLAARPEAETVATFANLGGDAVLVVPRPLGKGSGYAHLAEFARQAPSSQTDALWRAVGDALAGLVPKRPVWVSTAGLGVSWLHVRLDTFPKYYRFAPYARATC